MVSKNIFMCENHLILIQTFEFFHCINYLHFLLKNVLIAVVVVLMDGEVSKRYLSTSLYINKGLIMIRINLIKHIYRFRVIKNASLTRVFFIYNCKIIG